MSLGIGIEGISGKYRMCTGHKALVETSLDVSVMDEPLGCHRVVPAQTLSL